ncbi:tripartite motif-containing protein 2-like [Glandiceps talaboti]
MEVANALASQQLLDFFKCPMCDNKIDVPKQLPCYHSCCKMCLEKSLVESAFVECQLCRKRVTSEKDHGRFPDSQLLLQMTQRFGIQTDPRPQDLLAFNPTSYKPLTTLQCIVHNKPLLFCKSCDLPVCSTCDKKIHAGHRITTLYQAAENKKDDLWGSLTAIESGIQKIDNIMENLEKYEQSLSDTKQQVREEVEEFIQQLIHDMETQKEKLLGDLDEYCKTSKDSIVERRQQMQHQSEQFKETKDVVNSLLKENKEGDKGVFVCLARQAQNKLKDVGKDISKLRKKKYGGPMPSIKDISFTRNSSLTIHPIGEIILNTEDAFGRCVSVISLPLSPDYVASRMTLRSSMSRMSLQVFGSHEDLSHKTEPTVPGNVPRRTKSTARRKNTGKSYK